MRAAKLLCACLFATYFCYTPAAEIDFPRLLNAHTTPQDWLMPQGTYRAWRYSTLEQIHADNVGNLKVAWQHTPSSSPFGIQSTPLVADGALYYATAAGQVWALQAGDGTPLWRYQSAPRGPVTGYTRGLALGYGKVIFASGSGELVALDLSNGQPLWRTALIDTKKSRYRLGIPVVVKDKVIIGAESGGALDCCGPIFAVNVHNGATLWQFDTVAPEAGSRTTWGNDAWKNGGGGAWRAASYDYETNTVWLGTASPTPRIDWSASRAPVNLEPEASAPVAVRAGNNLYTSSVLALNADSGKLISYFQEIPHDVWGFDAASSDSVLFERDSKRYAVHTNKSGYVYVYERVASALKLANVWPLARHSNFVMSVNPTTGALAGRRDPVPGKHLNVCPSVDGAVGPQAGALNGRNGMYFQTTREWCHHVELAQAAGDAVTPSPLSARWQLAHPTGRLAYGLVSARDPLNGALIWEREYAQPPSGDLLTTAGNLLFVPRADGRLEALDVRTGKTLWTHNDGLAHQAGAITFAVNGKQYVAIATGWGTEAAASYATLFGEPYKSMPTDAGQLIVFSLPQ